MTAYMALLAMRYGGRSVCDVMHESQAPNVTGLSPVHIDDAVTIQGNGRAHYSFKPAC